MMLKTALNSTLSFSWKLASALALVALLHLSANYFLQINSSEHLLPLAYFVNFLLVIIGFFSIMLAKAKGSHSLGYIFLAGFLLKIAVFMLAFNPTYQVDGEIIVEEFFAFFVSYAFCLAFETKTIVKILNEE